MPINVFGAGQDALLGFLAERDAKQRLAEDRARRDRLDQESFADRQRQRDIQEGQLRSIDADREERRGEVKRLNDEKIAASEAKRNQDATVQTLVKEMLDPGTPQERKQAIGFELDRLQVSPSLIDKYLNPKPTTKPVYGVDPRAGTVKQFGEVPVEAQVINVPKTASTAEKPAFTPQHLLVLSQQSRRQAMNEARQELIDPSEIDARAHELENEGRATLGAPLLPEARPKATAHPKDIMLPASGVGAAAPPAAAPAPPQAPQSAAPAPELQQRAIAELQKRGKQVTPETIQYVIQNGLVK